MPVNPQVPLRPGFRAGSLSLKAIARDLILRGVAGGVFVLGPALRRAGRSPPSGKVPREILVIRLDLLGDVVFALSAAAALKRLFPDARVSMLTLPQTAPLALLSPDVDDVLTVDTNEVRSPSNLFRRETMASLLAALKMLRSRRFDVAVSLHGRTGSLLALLAPAQVRVGFDDEAYRGAIDLPLPGGRFSLRARRHDVDFCLRLVNEVAAVHGLDALPAAEPPRVRVESQANLEARLQKLGIESDDRLAVFHAGSGYGDFKRWPAGNFAALARGLAQSGVKCAVAGSASDGNLAQEVVAHSPAVNLAGATSMGELVWLLDRAGVVVSADSGPLHLAGALGTPVVGLYGPTDPEVNGPFDWRHSGVAVRRKDVACSPCYSVRTHAGCPLGYPVCMDLIGVEDVHDAVLAALGLSPFPASRRGGTTSGSDPPAS